MPIVKQLRNHIINIPGWQTGKKLLVIESDDWGSVRMASKSAYSTLLKKGYPVDKNPFNRFDSLESNQDMENLLGVLDSVKDKNNNPAIITLNNVVANPDFERIRQAGFNEYHYESFIQTLNRYPIHNRVFQLYREGIDRKLVLPQFHGREHLNVSRWMRDLRSGSKALHDAFEFEMFTLHSEEKPAYINEYLDSLDFDDEHELLRHDQILKEGYRLFTELWGFKSDSFIANCYVWHSHHEKILKNLGVRYFQGIANQLVPCAGNTYSYKRVFHYQGQKNREGQRYLLRNVFFEPYQNRDADWLNDCMGRIRIAFKWRKPAIISTHRVNFIGYLDEGFRDRNLKTFKRLLMRIVHEFPDIEFISSDELGRRMDFI